MLHLKHLSVRAGDKTILADVSYSFEKDKVYVVMGPNGSGKSTLAHTVMGHPGYTPADGTSILFGGEEITALPPEERASRGIFLSFQTPLSIPGVTVFQLLRIAAGGKMDPLSLRQKIAREAKALKIRADLLDRPLNEGASGGEKKKMEVLQASLLDPKLAIFDEVDTGVDIDALKTLSSYISKFRKGKTLIFITHNSRILKYICPDGVIVLKEGRIARTGGHELLELIESKGFENL